MATEAARRDIDHDSESLAPFPSTMPDADKFLFDTNGFVIVRDVFSAVEAGAYTRRLFSST